jgi:hypothetical protein
VSPPSSAVRFFGTRRLTYRESPLRKLAMSDACPFA